MSEIVNINITKNDINYDNMQPNMMGITTTKEYKNILISQRNEYILKLLRIKSNIECSINNFTYLENKLEMAKSYVDGGYEAGTGIIPDNLNNMLDEVKILIKSFIDADEKINNEITTNSAYVNKLS